MSRYDEQFKPQHFATTLQGFAHEVLPPDVYKARGVKGLQLMDIRLLYFVDDYRGSFGKSIVVNSYSWGGGYSQSGLRDVGHYGTHAAMAKSYSIHKYGGAIDFRSNHATGHELRKHFIENKEKFPQISFVEVGPVKKSGEWVDMTWGHFSTQTRTDWVGVRYWSPKYGFVTEEFVLENKL